MKSTSRQRLRELRFHDLRHTFGTVAISKASILQVKEWMGHANVQTTMVYLYYKSRSGEAKLISNAFEIEEEAESRDTTGTRFQEARPEVTH